jgi:hypothetical protein
VINLPDDVLLGKIETQKAYYDYKSLEKFTGKIGRKYKLAGKIFSLPPVLTLYPFFVLTTNKEACQKELTVCVQVSDWEDRQVGHLERESFMDIKKVDTLDKDEILSKLNDSENGFPYVARLSDNKFNELKGKQENLHKARRVSEEDLAIIQYALAEADVPEKILNKLLNSH